MPHVLLFLLSFYHSTALPNLLYLASLLPYYSLFPLLTAISHSLSYLSPLRLSSPSPPFIPDFHSTLPKLLVREFSMCADSSAFCPAPPFPHTRVEWDEIAAVMRTKWDPHIIYPPHRNAECDARDYQRNTNDDLACYIRWLLKVVLGTVLAPHFETR